MFFKSFADSETSPKRKSIKAIFINKMKSVGSMASTVVREGKDFIRENISSLIKGTSLLMQILGFTG